MKKNKLTSFYKKVAEDKGLQSKVKVLVTRMKDSKDLKNIIENELIPLANNYGFELTIADFLNEETELKEHLSVSELESVSGGISAKPFMFTALTLFGLIGVSAATGQAFADELPQNQEIVNESTVDHLNNLHNAAIENTNNDNSANAVREPTDENLNNKNVVGVTEGFDENESMISANEEHATSESIVSVAGNTIDGNLNNKSVIGTARNSAESEDIVSVTDNVTDGNVYNETVSGEPAENKKIADILKDSTEITNNINYTVSINGKQYESLESAIDDAKNGDTVVIDKNIVVDHEIKINNKYIYLIANGHKFIKRAENYRGYLFSIDRGTLNIGDDNIQNCLIIDGGQIGNCKSLIYCNSSLNIKNTKLCNNFSNDNGGVIYLYGGNLSISGQTEIFNNDAEIGGAVYCCNESYFSLSNNVQIYENEAIYGGAIYFDKGELNISGEPKLFNNSAKNGGSIYFNKGNFVIKGQTTFYNNIAKEGAAIYCFNKSNLFITDNVTFYNNSGEDGGAISFALGKLDISGQSKFYDNHVDVKGGAIYIYKAEISISGQVEFYGNIATDGGAIECENALEFSINDEVKIHHNKARNGGSICIFCGNLDISGQVEIYNNEAEKNAGAILGAKNVKLKLNDCVKIYNNTSTVHGGAIYMAQGELNMSGQVQAYNNFSDGGGFSSIFSGKVNISDQVEIHSNSANGGGAIFFDNGILEMSGHSKFYNNISQFGGALFIQNVKVIMLDKAEIYYNTAYNFGSGIYNMNSRIINTLSNQIHDNGDNNKNFYSTQTINLISDKTDKNGIKYTAQIRTIREDEEGVVLNKESEFDEVNSIEDDYIPVEESYYEEDTNSYNEVPQMKAFEIKNDIESKDDPFNDFDLSSHSEYPENDSKSCNICYGNLKVGDRVFQCFAGETEHIIHLPCLLRTDNHFTAKTITCPMCKNVYHLQDNGYIHIIDENIYTLNQ